MNKAFLVRGLGTLVLAALVGCTNIPGGTTTSSTPSPSSSPVSSIITQALTPICANTLKDRDIIPQQARDFGIDETAVCGCGLRRMETKLTNEPALFIEIFSNRDQQIKILSELSSECAAELLGNALLKGTGASTSIRN